MKTRVFVGLIFVFFLTASGFSVPQSQILYQTSELGAGRWQYTYDVTNISLTSPIEEFTIWFDFNLYKNLAVETPTTPAGWDQIVWQPYPEPPFQDDGGYDAKALVAGIAEGQTLGDFAVSFDWLGEGQPGSQPYDIIDPQTFEIIDSGQTIPEPATLLLLGLGTLGLRRKRWPRRH